MTTIDATLVSTEAPKETAHGPRVGGRFTKGSASPSSERPRVAWALFVAPAALSSGHTRIPAIAADERCKIYIDVVAGMTVLSVEEPSLATPGLIPWSNIAALGLAP